MWTCNPDDGRRQVWEERVEIAKQFAAPHCELASYFTSRMTLTTYLSPRRVALVVVGWLVLLLAGHRLFFQFRHAPVYVGSMPPLTARAQEVLIRNSPTNLPPAQRSAVFGARFNEVQPPPVTRRDLGRIRRRLAWETWAPYWVETLMIHDANHVTARVDDARVTWIELTRRDGAWRIERLVKTETAPRLDR